MYGVEYWAFTSVVVFHSGTWTTASYRLFGEWTTALFRKCFSSDRI